MPGQPAHFEIPADDTAKGRQFWGSLFDWQFEASPGPFEYHMTRISDQAGAAITNMEPGKRGIRTYFYVDDINAGAARVKELGGEANEPGSVPGMGWFATCSDPRGTSSACGKTTRPPQPQPDRPHQRQAASPPTRALPALVTRRPWSCSPANVPAVGPRLAADDQQRPVSKGHQR
jgi:uncharacterized protein